MELKTQRKVKNLNDTNKIREALTGLKFIFPVQRINMAQTQKTLYGGRQKGFSYLCIWKSLLHMFGSINKLLIHFNVTASTLMGITVITALRTGCRWPYIKTMGFFFLLLTCINMDLSECHNPLILWHTKASCQVAKNIIWKYVNTCQLSLKKIYMISIRSQNTNDLNKKGKTDN